ncbi:PrsW family glutamic-type intramembrane protease [Olsenella porci]|uniref:PrsW family intramembrane metalloprotease n=1 Tax=Olsenella porci TaxID=2652279 RepID=A0A6N7XNF6_9ACTN|nr:PrsW family glutamic-type intramembrane protease [Olsenella porci]MST71605.1 PrsW family intramembrane metalloprotease [Olsenella porci]
MVVDGDSRGMAPLEGNPFADKRRRWWVGLSAFLLLFLMGVVVEFGNMDRGVLHPASQTAARYQAMLGCFALVLVYLIPFLAFVRYTRTKAGVPRWLVVLALASGLFVPGWIAGELNDAASTLLGMVASKGFLDAWGDAIEAPIVEETLKVLTVCGVLALVGRRDARDWLVGGMCVGMGFQVSEDLSYIEGQIAGSRTDFATAIPFMLGSRVSGALVSHWTYTALAAVAVWLFFCQRKRLRGLAVFLVPLLDHFAWDSPVSDWGVLPVGLICLAAALPFLYVWGDIAFDDGKALLAPHGKARRSGAKAGETAAGTGLDPFPTAGGPTDATTASTEAEGVPKAPGEG